MLSRTDLLKLSLTEKRQVLRALLQRKLDTPRTSPLSYAQEQLWFMDRVHPGSPVYNIPLYIPFSGPLDVETLRRALGTLAARHDMLRVRFGIEDDQPVQIVEPAVDVALEVEDLARLPGAQQRTTLGHLLNEEVQRPFVLMRGCVRYRLFRLDPANHLLSVTMHHIVADAWSLGVYTSELNKVYGAYRRDQRDAPLAPLSIEYADYARWQRATLRGLRLSKLVSYWVDQLASAPHILHLPIDHPRPQDQTFNGTVAGFVLDDRLSEALIALGRQHKVTLFMLLLACYYTLLYRYTGQEDILVGVPVANRDNPDLEPVIGIFVNTLILRARPHDTQTFTDLLADVQGAALAAYEHQALPFPKLVEELKVERIPGYPPLYQVVCNFQNASLIESANPGAEGEVMHDGRFPLVHSNTAKVDLNLTITQNGSRISGGFEYNTDLFERQTIDGMIEHFRMITEQVSRDASTALIDIPLEAVADAGEGAAQAAGTVPAGPEPQPFEPGRFSFEPTSGA
jgi:NRPS condensation-like uncharacterized protein